MPPKKEAQPEAKPVIGRIGTNLKVGIVGLPNVGKSTFFNVLTKSQAAAENFPFCTIDPNENNNVIFYFLRRVPVPDARFEFLCDYFKPLSKQPAYLNVVDIAGLVKGASEGHGLGNAFLSNISACDAVFHLCRAFEDDDVTHVEGEVNPVRDLDIIGEELILKDLEYLNNAIDKLEKSLRGAEKPKSKDHELLVKIRTQLKDERKQVRFSDWSASDIEILNKHLLLTAKPAIYLVNLSEKDFIRKKNKWLIKLKDWVDKNDSGAVMIPFSGELENKLIDMDASEKEKFLNENKTSR
uniref:OBG-type G domain-containing protein n=1 Tax=Strigamia maritima TaxID=126957 RepID=T1IUW9_STRMM